MKTFENKIKCDGTERHEHYVIGTSQTVVHQHEHTVMTEEFNRLHHHAPVEHANFTQEELTVNVVYITKTPF